MRPEKVFRLGSVSIEGDLIEFEPARELDFEADRRDVIMVGVAYRYREASEEKERTRIRITAHLEGERPESHEAVIGDNPALDDSRRGFVSVAVHVRRAGELRGRFTVETSYGAGPWVAAEPAEQSAERAEGAFTLHVRA